MKSKQGLTTNLRRVLSCPKTNFTKEKIKYEGYINFIKLPLIHAYIYEKKDRYLDTYKDTRHYERSFTLMFEILYKLIHDAENNRVELKNPKKRIELYTETLENLQLLYTYLQNKGFSLQYPQPSPPSYFHKMHPSTQKNFQSFFKTPALDPPPSELIIEFSKDFPQDAFFKSTHQIMEIICTLANPLILKQTDCFDESRITEETLNLQSISLEILKRIPEFIILLRDLDLHEYSKYRQHLRGTSGGASPNLRWMYNILLSSPITVKTLAKDLNQPRLTETLTKLTKDLDKLRNQQNPSPLLKTFLDLWHQQVEEVLCAFYTHHSLAIMTLGNNADGTTGSIVSLLNIKHTLKKHPLVRNKTVTITSESTESKNTHPPTPFNPTNLKLHQEKLDVAIQDCKNTRQKLETFSKIDIENKLEQIKKLITEVNKNLQAFLPYLHTHAENLNYTTTKLFIHDILKKDQYQNTWLKLLNEINETEMKLLTLIYRQTILKLYTHNETPDPAVNRTLAIVDEVMSEQAKEMEIEIKKRINTCEIYPEIGCLIIKNWPQAKMAYPINFHST